MAQTFSNLRNELDLVWQPLPSDLYPLALELQKQVSLTNEIINNNVTTTKKISAKNNEQQKEIELVKGIIAQDELRNPVSEKEQREKEIRDMWTKDKEKYKAFYQTEKQEIKQFVSNLTDIKTLKSAAKTPLSKTITKTITKKIAGTLIKTALKLGL